MIPGTVGRMKIYKQLSVATHLSLCERQGQSCELDIMYERQEPFFWALTEMRLPLTKRGRLSLVGRSVVTSPPHSNQDFI